MYFSRMLGALLVSLIFVPYAAHAAIGTVPSTGLVGHWSLDEGAGTTAADSSGNAVNATLVNSPAWVAGIAGNALSFASSSQPSGSRNYLGFPSSLQGTSFPQTGTLSFWVKGDFTAQSNLQILDSYATNRAHIFVRSYTSAQGLQIVYQDNDASGTYLNQAVSLPNHTFYPAYATSEVALPVPTNTWTNITLEWDGVNKVANVYKNGSLAITIFYGAYTSSWSPNEVFRFGDLNTPASFSLDDIALYNRVLSGEEVQSITSGTSAPAVDVLAPSAPAEVRVGAQNASKMSVALSPSTDDHALGGYILYRNGVPLVRLASTTLSYTDTGLATSTTYTYSAYAYDSSGNRSVVSSAASATTASAAVLLTTSFEADAPDPTAAINGWYQQGPNTSAVAVSTDRARAGAQSVKMNFNYSDWNGSDVVNGLRAEILPSPPEAYMTTGQTYWLGLSYYIPSSWIDDYSANNELIFQVHGSDTNGPASGGSPPLALYIYNNQEFLSVRGATSTVYAIGTSPAMNNIYTGSFTADKGTWTDWIFQYNYNYTNGFVKAWKNGLPVANYVGPTIYHTTGQTNETGIYAKAGDYKYFWGTTATMVSNRTLYFDEITLGSNNATCGTVRGAGAPSCIPALSGVSIASNNASTTTALPGNVVTVFTTSDQDSLLTPTAVIAGHQATVSRVSTTTWAASTTLSSSDSSGLVTFSFALGNMDGTATSTATTSVSSVLLHSAPVLSSIAVSGTTQDSTTISWISDITTTSKVVYGLDAQYGMSSAYDPAQVLTHISTLYGLSAGTTYHYAVVGTDAYGNTSTSSDQTVMTLSASAPPNNSGGVGGGGGSSGNSSSGSSNSHGSSGGSHSSTSAPATTTSSTIVVTSTWSRPLTVGSVGTDVKVLQLFLNQHGFVIAATGAGSPGNETTYFGLATQAALARFQTAHGIVPASGYFGPLTQRAITTSAQTTVIAATPVSTPTVTNTSYTYARSLTVGSSGSDVVALQTFLTSQGFTLPSGATGYFGAQTKAALASFQAAHGIVPASGYFGPLTRDAILTR